MPVSSFYIHHMYLQKTTCGHKCKRQAYIILISTRQQLIMFGNRKILYSSSMGTTQKGKIIYYLLFSFTRSSQQLDRCITFMTFSVHEKAIFVDSMKLGVFDRIHCKICSIIAFSFWTGYFRQYMKYHWLNGLWFSKSFDICHILWNYTTRCFYNDLFIGRKKYV